MKLNTPKGTRDFSPAEMVRRNYIFDTIKNVFKKYGYQPIETPAMENSETLMGKYGEEGDRLIFKLLDSGKYIEKNNDDGLEFFKHLLDSQDEQGSIDWKKVSIPFITDIISSRALRYDLTVPFAQKRDHFSFQTLSGAAGLESRPSTKRAIPGVLSMRY